MLTKLQKHAPTISILLLVALLVALFFFPPFSRVLSTIIIVFGIGTAIIFTVHGNWLLRQDFDKLSLIAQEPHGEGKITRSDFVRNTIIDLLGMALVMSLAIFFGRLAGGYAGNVWGIFTGIIAGMVVGFGVAFGVNKIWGKVTEPMKA